MAEAAKDTIYIDVDDEITSVIDKMRSSKAKIVALVLPKRASVFHSIVNMKLLKRSAETAKKNIVLITSEASILPLAGAVGLHVAKTLQSKPSVPAAPTSNEGPITVAENDEPALDKAAPIGMLAGIPDEEEEAIEVDNAADAGAAAGATKAAKSARNKKLKIPNFESFRLKVFLGVGALILLIVFWIFAALVLPKAKITIKTDTTTISNNITFTASPKATSLDKEDAIVPAENKEYKKTDAVKVPATGEKNNGTKATGKVTLTLTDCSKDQVNVPAGTGVTSGNLTFLTQADVLLKSVKIGSQCRNSDFPDFSTATVNVAAQNPGDQYNLSARSYSVSGFGNVSANGTAMSGGTSQIIKIVTQGDVDGAKQKILDQNLEAAKSELSKQLKADGYLPIAETYGNGNAVVTASPNVGEEANEVNVNVVTTYTMIGAKEQDVKTLLEDEMKKHIDTAKQAILDNGLGSPVFQILDKRPNGDVKVSLQTEGKAGVAQDADSIKKAVVGKKKGQAQEIIQTRPGVKEVNVNLSPFWVTKVPKKLNKITVVFEQADAGSRP